MNYWNVIFVHKFKQILLQQKTQAWCCFLISLSLKIVNYTHSKMSKDKVHGNDRKGFFITSICFSFSIKWAFQLNSRHERIWVLSSISTLLCMPVARDSWWPDVLLLFAILYEVSDTFNFSVRQPFVLVHMGLENITSSINSNTGFC